MRVLIAAIISVGLSACVTVRVPASEDAAVLSAIIQDRCAYAARHSERQHTVLSAESVVVDPALVGEGLSRSAIKSLLSRNDRAHPLPALTLCPAYELAPQQEIDAAMDRKDPDGAAMGWEGFHKVFPTASGVSYLSLPGYSRNGTLAVVQVSGACADLCGSGFYWILRKIDGKWFFEKSVSGWVS